MESGTEEQRHKQEHIHGGWAMKVTTLHSSLRRGYGMGKKESARMKWT